jgi:phage terminase large subunit-like protein
MRTPMPETRMTRKEMEQFIQLGSELATRRAQDPLENFSLHPRQRIFCDSVLHSLKPENWFIAANRSGKSDAGAYCGAHLARFGYKEQRPAAVGVPPVGGARIEVMDRATSGWVSALDFPTSRDVLQPKYFDNGHVKPGANKPFIPDHEIQKWSPDDKVLRLKNGSVIGFKSADSGRAKYQGAGQDWFHMDEEHPYDVYEESVIRVGTRKFTFFCTCTILPPEGLAGATSWVFPKIIRPWQEGRLPHMDLFGASIYDNPHIPVSEIRRLESIYPEGSTSRRIRLGGEWLPGLGGSRAYSAFDRTIHVRPMGDPDSRRPLCWVWDFNVDPLCSLVGQYDGQVFRVYREIIMHDGGNIPEMCQMFYDKFPRHDGALWLYGDASSEARTAQTGKTDYWIIRNEMKHYGRPIVQKVPESNPPVPDRINSVNHALIDEDGMVGVQIDTSCQELSLDLEEVMRDNKGGIKKVNNKKDPYFYRTHISDALGYWISYEAPIRVKNRNDEDRPSSVPRPSYGRR